MTTTAPLGVIPREVPHLDAMGEWYHNFDSLGVRVRQRPKKEYRLNQASKEPALLGFIQTAIAKAKNRSTDKPSVLELFCADGYYSCHAKRMGAGQVTGIDLDQPALDMANAMYSALFNEPGRFMNADVFTYKPDGPVDILMNCGGLYHITDPKKLIQECRPRFLPRFMIVQSVVTTVEKSPRYFVTPAPGWNWGCRFTMGYLRKTLEKAKWKILDSHFNILEGNDRPCDQGSAYFLCEWT